MWSSAAVAHLLQGLTCCAFRDGILHTLVVSSGYLSYWCLSIVSNHFYVVNCWPSGKYVHLLYMYSILGRGSFCFNYCLNSAWHGGDQFVALLMWYGSPGFFDSGLQLSCICWSLVSHFPLDIDSLWGSGLVSLLASQAHQHHGHLTNFWGFWQCGQVPNPAVKLK